MEVWLNCSCCGECAKVWGAMVGPHTPGYEFEWEDMFDEASETRCESDDEAGYRVDDFESVPDEDGSEGWESPGVRKK